MNNGKYLNSFLIQNEKFMYMGHFLMVFITHLFLKNKTFILDFAKNYTLKVVTIFFRISLDLSEKMSSLNLT